MISRASLIGLTIFAPALMVVSTKSLGTTVPALAILGALAIIWSGPAGLTAGRGASFGFAAAGLALAILSLAWTPMPMQATPLLAAMIASLAALPCAKLLFASMDTRVERAFPALGLALLAVALVTVLAFDGSPREAAGLKAESFRMNRPSLVLAVLLLPALALLRVDRHHAAMALLVGVAAFPLAFTESQAAHLAVAVGMVVLVAAALAPGLTVLLLAVLGAGAILLMPVMVDFAALHLTPEIQSILRSAHVAERLDIWQAYRSIIDAGPLLGLGFEASRHAGANLEPGILPAGLPHALLATHPHNAALQIWVEFGALGATIAAAFWLAAMREALRLSRRVRPWAIALFASLFAVAMVSHGAWQAWWLALIVLSVALIHGADAAERSRETVDPGAETSGRILYLATEDWFFASHFLGMARTAAELGLVPVLAARAGPASDRITGAGIDLIDVPVERRSRSPATVWRSIRAYRRIIRETRPAIIHCIALKPVLLGGLAALSLGHRAVVLAPTGLGASFVEGKTSGALTRLLVRRLLRLFARRPGWRLLFENNDDPRALGIAIDPRVTIVPGAGVAADAFPPQAEPTAPPLRAAMVCRMVGIKGVGDAVEAVRLARADRIDVTLDLWGDPDPSNPTAIPAATLRAWSEEPGIQWHGRTQDVHAVWRNAHVAMQLSRGGEGLPRTIVEAKASARPVIATDVPGCRQAVRHAVDGIIVPPRDPDAAAAALRTLFRDPALRRQMGLAARADFEARLAEPHILAAIKALYRSMLTRPQRDP